MPNDDRYITNNNFNRFSGVVLLERLKQAKLATNNDLNTVEKCAIKIRKKNNRKLQIFHLSVSVYL